MSSYARRVMAAAAAVTLTVTLAVGGCTPGWGGRFAHESCRGHGGLSYYHDIKGLVIAHCNDGSSHRRGLLG